MLLIRSQFASSHRQLAWAAAIPLVLVAVTAGLLIKPQSRAATLPAGVTLRQIDGGPNYYASKNAASAWMDQHILLGAWLEQPLNATEVGYDAAAGENFYWSLPSNPTDTKDCGGSPCRVDYATIRAGGMHASAPDYFTAANDKMDTGATNTGLINGSETVEFDGSDESDMNDGPGNDTWVPDGTWPNNCVPAQNASPAGQCGFTADNWYYTGLPSTYGSTGWPYDGRPIHQGAGKGVLFWESDQDAAKFMTYADTESADSYWMTDSDLNIASQGGCALFPSSNTICNGGGGAGLTDAQRKLPANYEYDVTKLEQAQALNGSSKPVAVDVETGCPFNNGNCTTPPAMVAAAWHSLIAGARGIIWFQHNFSGNCFDFRTIIDGSNPASSNYNCQQTPGVTLHNVVQAITAFDNEVTSLNAVLLSPFADGYASTPADVSLMTKYSGNNFYIFAGSGKPGVPPAANLSATFTIPNTGATSVIVVDENRTIPITGNGTTFADTFADANAHHFYEVIGSTSSVSPTPTPSATPAGKIGDINSDGQVNIFDLSILLSHWNTSDAASDLNHDGSVNVFDLSILLSHWGT